MNRIQSKDTLLKDIDHNPGKLVRDIQVPGYLTMHAIVLVHFRDKARQWSKIVIFHTPTTFNLPPPLGGGARLCSKCLTDWLNRNTGIVSFILHSHQLAHNRENISALTLAKKMPHSSEVYGLLPRSRALKFHNTFDYKMSSGHTVYRLQKLINTEAFCPPSL